MCNLSANNLFISGSEHLRSLTGKFDSIHSDLQHSRVCGRSGLETKSSIQKEGKGTMILLLDGVGEDIINDSEDFIR